MEGTLARAIPEMSEGPSMQSRAITEASVSPRSWAIVFRGGDEVMAELLDFATREGLQGGHFSGIGAFSSAKLGFFDRATLSYKDIPIDDQVECLSLNGTIGMVDGEPMLHVHCTVGYPDGTVRGGHMLEAFVWPTLEVFLTESATPLVKHKDPESTLELYDFQS